MKKRDFYILGFLFCVIIYAASHRKANSNIIGTVHKEALVPETKTDIEAIQTDSLNQYEEKVIKAEV